MSTTSAPSPPAGRSRPLLGRGAAVLLGILAGGAALGTGHLVAALLSPGSSPFLAVGDTVIRHSPEFLTEFAKTTFGTADKPVLLSGMAVVIAIVAALAGVVARRRAAPGLVVVGVLGVLGIAAVATGPAFAPVDLVAPAVALVAGLGVFAGLHALATRVDEPDSAHEGGVPGAGC